MKLLTTIYLLLLAQLCFLHAGENHDSDDAFWADAAALLPGFTGTPAEPGASNQDGRWGSVINWPHVPVSAASLPNGKIMTFSGQERDSWPGTKTQTYWTIFDPVTNRFDESLYLDHEMFCAHLVMRTDGMVQTVGGRYTIEHSSVFDFRSNEWKRVDNMDDKRWYTTSVALPDGDVFTVAGSGGPNTAERYSPENDRWTKLTGINWQPVSGAAGFESDWWPYLWVAPSGQLFHFGPTEAMHWVNPDGNGQRTSAGISVPNNHYPKHAGVTMYDSGKILVAGGAANTSGGSTNICYTVDLNTTPPTVQQVASMRYPRRFSNAVVLPSGEVMIVGGNTSGKKFSDSGTVLTPEIWNPRTNTWREVAGMARPRNYHSVALLLADGRVFAGGNGYPNPNQQNGEIYTPPSLYNSSGQLATRPTLTSAPDNVSCGSVFQVQGTPNLKKFSAIRLVATTHGLTTDQRYLNLPFSETTSGTYQLVAHPNQNVMIPGYWMLFGINATGVHSVSKIIHVNETANASMSGLKGSYHNSIDLTNKRFERIDHQVNFSYGTLSPDTAQVGNDNFSTRWDGWVIPDTSGTYTFYTLSDDGVRLWVNNQQIVNNWTLHAPTENSGTISLTAGVPVPLRLEHYESTGGATIRLSWSGPGVAKQVVPEKNLRHANPSSTSAVAVDDVFELYVDGKLVSIGTEWNRAYHAAFSTGNSSVIAIRACNTAGSGSALGDFVINGTRIVTNGQWKVSTTAVAGWNQPGFNDSSWSSATDLGGVPAGVVGMPTNSSARSIWSANATDDEVFLRFTVGAPDIGLVSNRADISGQTIDFTIPVTAASGSSLTFSKSGFPAGVNINASTGRVTGTLSSEGVFSASVTVTDQNGLSDSVSFQWVVRLPGQGSGSILREWWTGIPGEGITNLTSDPRYPSNPTGSAQVTAFPTSQNFADNYGTRLRGYLHAPVTGTYRFWISTDDGGTLLLSNNDNPINATSIATVPAYAGVTEWTKYPEQASAAITLQGGQRYYVEILQKDGGGGDHINVAWRIPGDTGINVIDASFLSPFQPNLPPSIAALQDRSNTIGQTISLSVTANDPDNDTLSFSATNLPASLGINSSTGVISGTLSAVGTFTTTVSVSDGNGHTVSDTFVWAVNPGITVPNITPSASPSGSGVSYTAAPTGGTNPRYKWNFGDGSGDSAYSSSPSITHTYTQPGRYAVTFTATDDSGVEVSTSFVQNIYPQLTAARPNVSQSVLFEARSDNDRVWNVNPDNDSVSVFDAVTNSKLAEISVGDSPRSLALAANGVVWVTNKSSASISRIRVSDLQALSALTLPRGCEPHGIVVDPQGQFAYVALEGSGEMAQLNASTGAEVSRLTIGSSPRHLSVSADGSKVYVSKFISPPVPGEGTATPDVSAAGGELLVMSTAPFALTRTIILGHSNEPDSGGGGRGIPNYLGPASLSPAGDMAWLPSKKDNILRGTLRDGRTLDHDSTVRSISSRINLLVEAEDQEARIDHDDASIASTALFGPNGLYVFVALEGNREVAVIDAYGDQELFRFDVGRAPQGLALSADGRRLFVHNFMSRTVSSHNISGIIDQGVNLVTNGPVYNTVASEALSTQVLLGKQLFYDARDNRLTREDYMSCAACHNDGDHDGRVWDFTGFGEGLRNTIDLRGRGGVGHGPLHWSANFDEVQDFENQIRGFAEGTGLIASGSPHPPLGSPNAGRSADLDALVAYVSSLGTTGDSPFRQSNGDLTTVAAQGKEIFRAMNCAECHSGTNFTDSAPNNLHDIGTLKASSGFRLNAALTGIDTPTLRGLWNGAPFLHDGSAASLADAITAHNNVSVTSGELTALVAYLQQIDGAESAAPSNSAPSLTNPGNQTHDQNAAINLALSASDPNGDSLRYTSTSLPTGLTLGLTSGVISGTVTSAGTFNVTISVDDQLGGIDSVSFVWTVRAVSTADDDLLTNFVAPAVVQQGESVVVTIDYESTQAHELWIWLQDSNSGWRTVATDNLTLTPGIGTHTFNLDIAGDARVGDGYVWAVRLLPQGWVDANDALSADYLLAAVQTGTGGGGGGGEPTADQLGGINFPSLVTSPGSVTLEVPYEATTAREIRVWLHDPENGWFSIVQGGVVIERGFGTHTFSLPVLPDARVGAGYVWALRLLPLDWATADDALDARYAEASAERATGGGDPTRDAFVSVQAPALVQAAGTTTVLIEYEATQRREIGLWLHDVNNNWQTSATEIRTIEPGFGNEVFTLGVASDARLGDGHLWAIRLLPEGWATSDEALDQFYKDVTMQELDSTTGFINLASEPGVTATQSSVFGTVFTADLVHDGNTDGDWRNGSVNHTELDVNAWWEIDLGSVQDINHINVWNRTDCCGDEWLRSYHVLVSDVPFVSTGLTATIAQSGVSDYAFTTPPSSTQRVTVERTGRYVRIQLSGANYLALAEVEVFGPGEVFQLAQQVDVASTGLISNRQVTAASNVDGDAYDLATEYALGLNPYEVSPVGLLNLEPDAEENGMMQVWYERPARLGEIRYTLEYSADMVSWHSFPGGEVTSAGYGRERVTHRDLGGLHRGFVRLRVRNYDWNYESVTATQTWMETTLSEGFQTHGVSVSQPAILRSTIQNWDDSGVTVSVSNLQERFVEGQPYYMEITSGPLAGNRLDIDTESSTDSMIACDWSAPHNTLEQMPESSDWLGAEIALRPHWTMSQVYAKDAFVGGTVLEDADQVLFFNGVDYDAYFLLKADGYDQWTAQEDDALDSADSLIIPPGVGGFIKRPEGATPVSLVVTGEARSGAFIQPLSDGFNLLASPRPVDFDFTTRLLTLSDGFTGSRDPDTADQVQLWQGDAEPGKQGYDSYFLLDAGAGHQYWTEIGPDLPNVNASRLFLGDRAFFLKISGPAPLDYQLPAVIETPVSVID